MACYYSVNRLFRNSSNERTVPGSPGHRQPCSIPTHGTNNTFRKTPARAGKTKGKIQAADLEIWQLEGNGSSLNTCPRRTRWLKASAIGGCRCHEAGELLALALERTGTSAKVSVCCLKKKKKKKVPVWFNQERTPGSISDRSLEVNSVELQNLSSSNPFSGLTSLRDSIPVWEPLRECYLCWLLSVTPGWASSPRINTAQTLSGKMLMGAVMEGLLRERGFWSH